MLGLTQQRCTELIGVVYPQARRYEKGVYRISAGRLHRIASALNVDVGYFFEGIEPGAIRDDALIPQSRLLLALMRNFIAIPVRRHQEEIISLARALQEPDARRRHIRGRSIDAEKEPQQREPGQGR
jgi:transcriptional regulator with XRE-family HTH domain